ncbi:hypothetical protein Tco_1481726 [Tanacetum coccineum]
MEGNDISLIILMTALCQTRLVDSGRLGRLVPRMALNVEVNLRGILGHSKSDLWGDEYRVQLGYCRA